MGLKSLVCVECRQCFESVQSTALHCAQCKKPRNCECGCGKLVKTPGRYYAAGHNPNTQSVESHRKQAIAISGVNNPAKRKDVREAISRGVAANRWTHKYPAKAQRHAAKIRQLRRKHVTGLERRVRRLLPKT